MSVQIVSNADEIFLQTLQYITSSNPKFAVLCTVREVVKMAAFQTKLNNEQDDRSPWFACQLRNEAAYNQYRDRCFLAPYRLIELALGKADAGP